MILGYGPPQTDLPGAVSAGLQLGQRGLQMQADETEQERQARRFGLEQEYKQSLLDIRERGETRLEEKQEFEQTTSFDEEKRQFAINLQQAQRVLSLDRDKMESNIAIAVGQKGAARNVLLRELEQSEAKDKKIPGKWDYDKANTVSKLSDLDYQLSKQVAGLTKQHEDNTSSLRTAVQQDMERFQEDTRKEEAKLADERDQKILDTALGVVGRYDGDPIALEKTTNAMLKSYNPIMREVASYMVDVGSTSRTPEGLLRDWVDALPPDAQERYAGKMIDKAFGPMVTSERQIDKTAMDLAKSVDNSMNPDMVGPLITMRAYYDDNELEGNSANFSRYLKDTLVYTSNAFDRINLAMAYIKHGEVPPEKKKEEKEVKTEKPKEKEWPQPKTRGEFISTLKDFDDDAEARAYYKKWLGKWQSK